MRKKTKNTLINKNERFEKQLTRERKYGKIKQKKNKWNKGEKNEIYTYS